MGRLLDAIERAPRERVFTCPRTELRLTVHVPTRAQKRAAAAYVHEQWGDRKIANAFDLGEHDSLRLEHLLANCVHDDDGPVGKSAIDALDERTLDVYATALRELEAQADPDSHTWTEDEVRELLEGVKKKDPRIEALLSGLDSTSLLSFLRTTAVLLER